MSKRNPLKSKCDGTLSVYHHSGYENSGVLLSDIIKELISLRCAIEKLKHDAHPKGPQDIVFRPQEKPTRIEHKESSVPLTPARKKHRDSLAELLGQKICKVCLGTGMVSWGDDPYNPVRSKCKNCNGTGYVKKKRNNQCQ